MKKTTKMTSLSKNHLMLQILSILPSSEKAALTISDIAERIEDEFIVARPSDDAVRDNLKRLKVFTNEHAKKYGILKEVRVAPKNYDSDQNPNKMHPKGYFLYKEETLSQGEYLVLLGLVRGDRTLNSDLSRKLINKLKEKVSSNSRASLGLLQDTVCENNAAVKLDEYYEVFYSAMMYLKKVTFKTREFRDDKAFTTNEEIITFSPYHLTTAHGKHYVIGVEDNKSLISSFRFDLIADVKITSESFTVNPSDRAKNIKDYLSQHPLMYNGDWVGVKLRVHRDALLDVRDTFGDISPRKDGSYTSNDYYLLDVKATEEDVFRWAMLNTDKVEVLSPQKLRLRLVRATDCAKKQYLQTDEDFYFAQIAMAKESIKSAKVHNRNSSVMVLEDVDLEQIKHKEHEILDVNKAVFLKCHLTDISFLPKSKNLNGFYTEENDIKDYSPLGEVINLTDIVISQATIENLDFLIGCKRLRNLTLHRVRIKNSDSIYRTFSPQLDKLQLSSNSTIDIERFKLANPSTNIFVTNSCDKPRMPVFYNEKYYKSIQCNVMYPYNTIINSITTAMNKMGFSDKKQREIEAKITKDKEIERKIFENINSCEDKVKNIFDLYFNRSISIYDIACELNDSMFNIINIIEDAANTRFQDLICATIEKYCYTDPYQKEAITKQMSIKSEHNYEKMQNKIKSAKKRTDIVF